MRKLQLMSHFMVGVSPTIGRNKIRVYPHCSISIVLKVLSHAFRPEKETKSTQIGQEEVKLSLFGDDMVIEGKNSHEPNLPKLLGQISEFNKSAV